MMIKILNLASQAASMLIAIWDVLFSQLRFWNQHRTKNLSDGAKKSLDLLAKIARDMQRLLDQKKTRLFGAR